LSIAGLKKTRAGPANDVMDGRDFVTHFTFDIHPGPFGYSTTTCDNFVQKTPGSEYPMVHSIMNMIYAFGAIILKFTEPHDYVLKRSASFKVKVDKNWVRRGSRD
jgi:hypothetical protein